jgi:predicted nucleic acid-binding protein
MTVYVESNFVLEIALGQEQASAAEAILDRAEGGEVKLALPAFSLSEPFAAVRRRANDTQRLGNELRHQLNELGRSGPH